MNYLKRLFFLSITCYVFLSAGYVNAADFDWMKGMNINATADPTGFRAQLSTRFNLGDAQVKVVLGNVDDPADAYMVLRLGEMSSQPVDSVMRHYQKSKGQGWGVLAKSLGIKPGSSQFKDLKNNNDLGTKTSKNNHNSKSQKSKSKGKGKG